MIPMKKSRTIRSSSPLFVHDRSITCGSHALRKMMRENCKNDAFMADIQYFPSAPPVPGNIRLITNIYRDMIETSATEASDHRVYNVIWTTPDINAFPARINFRIPTSNKSGWAVGRFVEGAYQADTLRARIVHLAVEDSHIRVTAELILKDTTRFRAYMLSTPHKRMAVGTALDTADDRSNPVLAMLENSKMASVFEPNTTSWKAARAILAGDADIVAKKSVDRAAITVNVSGTAVELNGHQVNVINVINWFNKESPILIIDSAYGAGKSLCTAVMAEEAVKKGQTVMIAAVQNSALDVICAKIAELGSEHMRPVRYVSELVAQDAYHSGPHVMATLMENLHSTHKDSMSEKDLDAFTNFAKHRNALREFMFTGVEKDVATREHKKLLFLEYHASQRTKILTRTFLKIYNPNVFLCTISSAINLTVKNGLWRRPSLQWSSVLLDEASMIPEATLIALCSRF
ncbi:unnamed protein product [Heligmosomoides polygyrus]|uniref:AAA_11 domain-containing protein n=1 Tax=Heligmosomoides polygyrus TaxID=6339 RepID=A0A183GRT6_HELPZ|nr:unnamed protein product [Heligmosomoides polygyrus]